jgi:hypothetical protein
MAGARYERRLLAVACRPMLGQDTPRNPACPVPVLSRAHATTLAYPLTPGRRAGRGDFCKGRERRATVPDIFACLASTIDRGGSFALLQRRRAVSIFALSAARAGRHIQIVSAASTWPIRREVNREPIEIERRMHFAE